MTNENVRLFPHDRLMRQTVLRLIPRWILPNHVTVLRFVLIPFVLFLLWREHWALTLILFLFAGFTDAIDGSLARTRKQITMWGTVADPVADKLLIGLVVIAFVISRVHPVFALAIIVAELLIIGGALLRYRRVGYMTANAYGKTKMFLQVTGVALILLAEVLREPLLIPFAIGVLAVAILFAAISFLTYSF